MVLTVAQNGPSPTSFTAVTPTTYSTPASRPVGYARCRAVPSVRGFTSMRLTLSAASVRLPPESVTTSLFLYQYTR